MLKSLISTATQEEKKFKFKIEKNIREKIHIYSCS